MIFPWALGSLTQFPVDFVQSAGALDDLLLVLLWSSHCKRDVIDVRILKNFQQLRAPGMTFCSVRCDEENVHFLHSGQARQLVCARGQYVHVYFSG